MARIQIGGVANNSYYFNESRFEGILYVIKLRGDKKAT